MYNTVHAYLPIYLLRFIFFNISPSTKPLSSPRIDIQICWICNLCDIRVSASAEPSHIFFDPSALAFVTHCLKTGFEWKIRHSFLINFWPRQFTKDLEQPRYRFSSEYLSLFGREGGTLSSVIFSGQTSEWSTPPQWTNAKRHVAGNINGGLIIAVGPGD